MYCDKYARTGQQLMSESRCDEYNRTSWCSATDMIINTYNWVIQPMSNKYKNHNSCLLIKLQTSKLNATERNICTSCTYNNRRRSWGDWLAELTHNTTLFTYLVGHRSILSLRIIIYIIYITTRICHICAISFGNKFLKTAEQDREKVLSQLSLINHSKNFSSSLSLHLHIALDNLFSPKSLAQRYLYVLNTPSLPWLSVFY